MRPGYYVEGRYFRDYFHQARARAVFLACMYGRPVEVRRLDPGASQSVVVLTAVRSERRSAA